MRSIKAKYKPFPEVAENEKPDKPFVINEFRDKRQSGGMTDIEKRKMTLVLDENQLDVSIHEMAHVKWSPKKVPKVRFDRMILQCVEDARIGLGLKEIGLSELTQNEYSSLVRRVMEQDIESGEPVACMLRAIASIGSDHEDSSRFLSHKMTHHILPGLSEKIFTHVKRKMKASAKKNDGIVATFGCTQRTAREVALMISEAIEHKRRDIPIEASAIDMEDSSYVKAEPMSGDTAASDGFEGEKTDSGERAKKSRGRIVTPRVSLRDDVPILTYGATRKDLEECGIVTTSRLKDDEIDPIFKIDEHGISVAYIGIDPPDPGEVCRPYDEGMSGRMEIINPPLLVRQKDATIKRSSIPASTNEGLHVRRIDRLCMDGAIFAKKRSSRSIGSASDTTILIDVSGSMNFDEEELDSIASKCGGIATVATYSGLDEIGHLRIVSRDGYRCEPDQMRTDSFYGNIVDVPALRWLAGRSGRRIWLCDGHVTGAFDNARAEVDMECSRISKNARIIRVNDAERLASVLEGRF